MFLICFIILLSLKGQTHALIFLECFSFRRHNFLNSKNEIIVFPERGDEEEDGAGDQDGQAGHCVVGRYLKTVH